MAVQGGYGLKLRIDVAATPTVVVNLIDLEMPKFTKMIAETTGHDSASGYYTAVATGKRRVQPFKAVVAWDSGAATHAEILASFNADTVVDIEVEDPDGIETIAFTAHIEEIGRLGGQEDAYTAEIMIHPSGAATIT